MNVLENSVAGDKLAVWYGWNAVSIETVARTTKTLVITERHRFNRDGSVPGDGYARTRAKPATDEDLMAVRILSATEKLRELKVTAQNIEAIEGLLT